MKGDFPAIHCTVTDIDAEAIRWCNEHLSDVGSFHANNTLPPNIYQEGEFDFVYSTSIFTNLQEDMQHAWLAELRRIVAFGGKLFTTVQVENIFGSPRFAAKRT